MKKSLLIIAFAISQLVTAQPLTHTVLPPVNTTYTQYNVLNNIAHQPGGVNAIWNYNLTTNVNMTFSVSPSSVLTSTDLATFPNANYFTQVFSGASFFRLDMEEMNPVEFKLNGQRMFSGSYNYSPAGLITFPIGLSYGATHTFTFLQSSSTVTSNITYDGYGTLTASMAGTHSNVLRLKIKNSNSTDTIFKYYGTQPYMYLLFQYSKTTSGFLSGKYVYAYSFPTGIAEQESALNTEINIYPNPINGDYIFISKEGLSRSATFSVYDVTMTKVKTGRVDSQPIDVQALTQGVYFVEIKDGSGQIIRKVIKN